MDDFPFKKITPREARVNRPVRDRPERRKIGCKHVGAAQTACPACVKNRERQRKYYREFYSQGRRSNGSKKTS